MIATPTPLDAVEADLRRRHGRVRNLRLSDGADGLEVDGETSTFHAMQLLIRDIIALGLAPRVQMRVTVRGADGRPNSPVDPVSRPQPADGDAAPRRVLIAAADPLLLARCAARLAVSGYLVATAVTGLECLSELVSRRPDLLVLIGRLPWGGSSGVLHLAHEEGYLDRMTVAYLGDPDGLDGLSELLLGKLARVRLVAECDEDAVCGAVTAGGCSCAG